MDLGDLEGPCSKGLDGLEAVLKGLLQRPTARNIEALDRQADPYLPVNKLEKGKQPRFPGLSSNHFDHLSLMDISYEVQRAWGLNARGYEASVCCL